MPSPTEISVVKLSRIIGLPGAPSLIDVRPCDERGSGRQMLPAARQMKSELVSSWAETFAGRGADTGVPHLTPQSGGLLAISLGYSRMFKDDVAQLEATMPVYDALYRWCRDGTEETHG